MTFSESIKSIRTSWKENFSNHYRSSWLRYKNTRWYKNVDAMMSYREIYETLVNQ